MRVLFELDFAGVESENEEENQTHGGMLQIEFSRTRYSDGVWDRALKEAELHRRRCQTVTRPHKTSAHILGSSGTRAALLKGPE